MTDILKELYTILFNSKPEASEKVRALTRQEAELWDQVKPFVGLETIDRIANTHGAIEDENELEWFRRGLRLGAALVLEAMGPGAL